MRRTTVRDRKKRIRETSKRGFIIWNGSLNIYFDAICFHLDDADDDANDYEVEFCKVINDGVAWKLRFIWAEMQEAKNNSKGV